MEEILDLYELQYSDLMSLLSDETPASNEESERLQLISEAVMRNLGREGPGLLSVNGIPKVAALRSVLLPLARRLALMNNDDRKRILKDHSLGSDVPLKNLDRIVSSFAMQMKHGSEFNVGVKGNELISVPEVDGKGFDQLGFAFKELGFCMMEVGLCLARVCDRLIGGCELEQSLLQSGTAKGRLIHYHSVADNVAMKQAASWRCSGRGGVKDDDELGNGGKLELWQQWHYDYGIFTILTAPMFMVSDGTNEEECESPSGHTYLQVYDPKTRHVLMVKTLKDSFIVQVGESADVLSKWMLRATLHSVCRPSKIDNLSRETFVVFLQPSWNKTFSLSDYPVEHLTLDNEDSDLGDEEVHSAKQGSNGLTQKFSEIVPPLSSRLWDGMTFAEFSRQTTKQYYGEYGQCRPWLGFQKLAQFQYPDNIGQPLMLPLPTPIIPCCFYPETNRSTLATITVWTYYGLRKPEQRHSAPSKKIMVLEPD